MGERTGHLSRPPARRPRREAVRKRCGGHRHACCRQSRRHQPRRPDPSQPHTRDSRCVHTGWRFEKASSDPLPSPCSPQDKVSSTWSVAARALRGPRLALLQRAPRSHHARPHALQASSRWGTRTWQGQGSSSRAQASLTPSRAIKGKLSHSPQGGHTQRPMGPRWEGSRDAWSTSPEPHAAQPPCARMMQAINEETTGHSGVSTPTRKAVPQQPPASREARPAGAPHSWVSASFSWLAPRRPHPRGHPRKAGPRSRAEAFPQPTAVTSAGKEKRPQSTGLPRPTAGLPPGLPSLGLVWLSTPPFSEPDAL